MKESEIGLLLSFEPIRAPPRWNDAASEASARKSIDLMFEEPGFPVLAKARDFQIGTGNLKKNDPTRKKVLTSHSIVLLSFCSLYKKLLVFCQGS